MSDLYTKLPYHFISCKGDDAEKFLQGQTSCDVSKLEEGTATYGTVNSPKGRMYGLFLITRIIDGFLLRIHESTSEMVLSQLGKYKVFFKCELQREEQLIAYGTDSGHEKLAPFSVKQEGENLIVRLPSTDALCEVWSVQTLDNNQSTEQDAEAWHCQTSSNGLPELYGSTQDQFILQYLNLQDLNAVSFNKGCYTGQEIIARMKFLGKLKKKTFLLKSDDEQTVQAGSAIYDEAGKKCGDIVRSHWHPEFGSVALGILDMSYIDDPKPVFLSEKLDATFSVSELHYK